MAGDPIVFWHRGRVVEVSGVPTTTTVLEWLRGDARATGTKEGCNEGDCGACTVVVGDLDVVRGRRLRLRTVNSCLLLLPMLHGRALITVEDLVGLQGGFLHPAQQAMVEAHGSQCGFCTPGVVMSLWCLFERSRADGVVPARQEVADGLAGNLCRCTGYRPILDAGESMLEAGDSQLDVDSILTGLETIDPLAEVEYRADGAVLWSPTDVDGLARLAVDHPLARIVAGGTDAGLLVTQQLADLPQIIWTGRVAGLRGIGESGDYLRIGAGASLDDSWSALVERLPGLEEYAMRFASPSIRNVGTMGGNIVNSSPIGDSAPVLLVLDAELELRRGDVVRRLPLTDFSLGYQVTALQPGELLVAMMIPLSAMTRDVRAYKVSRRHDSDISTVSAAFATSEEGGLLREARVALGGMAPVVRRAARTEQAMVGRPWDASALADAQRALVADYQPISDHRASDGYRRQVAQALLARLWRETGADRAGSPIGREDGARP